MIKYFILLSFIVYTFKSSSEIKESNTFSFSEDTSVAQIEQQLGKSYQAKSPYVSDKNVSIEAGKKLVLEGFSITSTGKKSKKQSKHFVCTSCHNIQKEEADLSTTNAQLRLEYTSSHEIPFLQGSPLYGVVNRDSFYNGDYYLKYGELVTPARNNLREAIKLCATQCSQGRELEDWEVESILAYLWTIDLKMSDLNLSQNEKDEIKNAIDNNGEKDKALMIMQTAYLKAYGATFIAPPIDRSIGSGLKGISENGKLIYKNSCLHCHYNGRYSYLYLDETKMSKKYLAKHIDTYHRQSIYQVVRYGVPIKSGKRSYMPQYTLEKMSDQQLADLRAFIDQ